MPLSKAEFIKLVSKGQFSELIDDVLGKTPESKRLPGVSDTDGPKADDPMLAVRGAEHIGAWQGPHTPVATPLEDQDPVGKILRSIMGMGKVDKDGYPIITSQNLAPGGMAVEGEVVPVLAKKLSKVTNSAPEHLIDFIKNHIMQSKAFKDEGGWVGIKERPTGLKINKDPDFAFNGEYVVTLPNGGKTRIFKDPESGLWNSADKRIPKMMDGTSTPFGFNKEDMLTKLHEIMEKLK